MSYIKNRWYCAAWGHEVVRDPFTRTLLNEKVVLYRTEQGHPVALSNVCPHRFAPMHQGRLRGDDIECPYHGLRFSPDGACALNPHGSMIPPGLRLKSYPVIDRYAMVWIWMGEADEADPALIPEFPAHDDGGYKTVGGMIPVKGSYQLVADNLLDLSHTQFLHPILVVPDDPETRVEHDILQDGDTITTIYNQRNTRPFGFTGLIWPDAPERLDGLSGVRWDAPANMLLKLHFVSRDPGDDRELRIWGAELVTPETETSCHYFWSASRNFRLDDDVFGQQLGDAIANVFRFEDGAMIAEVQANMGDETDLIAMRPVILPTDQAAIRARRIVGKLLRAEQNRKGEPKQVMAQL
ncbi:aromatic ring-hydroxylating dioxygenase subunit alpha [Sphingobium phenoxybenzoativorans]|uniref:Aromatic ring-hydroxylating dioxygenase subunit alpha n=1 Tax=Sphingobium phenoxybenzoativorans TaxID=1592790 RepID=A0A975KAH4_9SPHN|nr:aromatic ring-hydroxylating dioxygenase subunit alpha [Sphingobium phenoxybenzoativorans]QUT07814.1 aromatic ring-hydroxylating dioxygenase subunit alpha [Sphingobium phenoxybenzoativorans]